MALAGLALCLAGLATGAAAQGRVGVTSAASGDPLGKPPALPERVLRIGVDVQANEQVTTGTNDRAHLVFLDGSSLTVGPNARLTIDKFVYDADKKTGEIAISATEGVFRLVGGRISKKNAILVTTPSATIGVRGGIVLFEVARNRTVSTFAFGISMAVTGQGVTETVTRQGWQVTTLVNARPGPAIAAPLGALTGNITLLEGRSRANTGGNSGGGNSGGARAGGGGITQAAATVIVNGTQTLAAQPATPVSATPPIVAVYQNVQNWNPSPNMPQGATNPGLVPTNIAAANPDVTPPGTGPSFVLPMTGSATYSGTVVGADTKIGSFTGNFSMGWNFANRNGSFTASGGPVTATAPVTAIGTTPVFAGPLSVTVAGSSITGSGAVAGVFTSSTGVTGAFAGTTTNNSTFGAVFTGKR
jgi:hypothetical protein